MRAKSIADVLGRAIAASIAPRYETRTLTTPEAVQDARDKGYEARLGDTIRVPLPMWLAR